MSDLTNLQTAKSSLISEIATAEANPRPNYQIDGQMVNYESYVISLYNRLEKLDLAIVRTEGGFEDQSILL